jgi:hypothetical protein
MKVSKAVPRRAAAGKQKKLKGPPVLQGARVKVAPPDGFTAGEVAAYDSANQALVSRYPTLDVVLNDPDAFVTTMEARFDEQKKLTPANPYAFDFSEYGLPVMKQVSAALAKEIREASHGAGDPDQRLKAVGYFRTLKSEIDRHVAGGSISYRRSIELAYYASEALGVLDYPKETRMQRAFLVIDRYLDGYTPKSLETQVDNYKHNTFSVFDTAAPHISGLDAFQKKFDDAFFATDKLEMISLPTMEPLGLDIFFRLSDYNLFPLGVAADPIGADGFVRPGGDFWTHDLRHSSDMFGRRKIFESEHHMTEPQIRKLQKRIDVWRAELLGKLDKISDANLKGAVTFLMFNWHHDRGRPMVPSSFLAPKVDSTPKLLHMMEALSGQDSGFKGMKTLQPAYDWLRGFWLPKLDEEKALLGDIKLGAAT